MSTSNIKWKVITVSVVSPIRRSIASVILLGGRGVALLI